MENNTKTQEATMSLKEYLDKGKEFVVPSYQRGYVWGKKGGEWKTDSVTYLINSIKSHSEDDNPLFLQGITVTENDNEIILIDGQQRTTCLYIILRYLGYDNFKMRYEVRTDSRKFLEHLYPEESDWKELIENPNDESQDIFFFKRTIRIVRESELESKSGMLEWMLEKVRFLYIDVPEEKAIPIFTMMNGAKAIMSEEDLIKAEFLRLVSLGDEGNEYQMWEQNLIRSRYAREWDKWTYWWHRKKVQKFYRVEEQKHPLNMLLSIYASHKKVENYDFGTFKTEIIDKERAKNVFYEIRSLQKNFEETFADPATYNKVGSILQMFSHDDRLKFLEHYMFEKREVDEKTLDKFYNYSFIGATFDEIKEDKEALKEKVETTRNKLGLMDVYNDNTSKEDAYRQLLRLNVNEDINLKRFFDFEIYSNRSLEHIFPKSKSYYVDNDEFHSESDGSKVEKTYGMLDRAEFAKVGDPDASVHCIGNLVLLYGRNNSEFGAKSFEDKKALFFKDGKFESRSLLHTIKVFANQSWGAIEIITNKHKFFENFDKTYDVI